MSTEPVVPVNNPDFDNTQTNFLAPTAGHQANGFVTGEEPASNEINGLFWTWAQWFKYLYAKMLIQPGAQADTALVIDGSNHVVPTQGNHGFSGSGTVNAMSTANHNPGRIITLKGTSGQTVVLAHQAGSSGANIQFTMADGNSVTLLTPSDIIEFRLNTAGTSWTETFRSASLSTTKAQVCEGRLTLTSGLPVTTADVLAATNIYFTPYKGNSVSLYNGSTWAAYSFSELALAVPASTSQMYDVFIYLNAGALTLEAVAWTNDTTRATALALQNGVYVKNGSTSHAYLGSFRTTGASGQTEDSLVKRYVWNYYNRVRRNMAAKDATGTWAYTSPGVRQANANAANQLDFVVGVSEDAVTAEIKAGGQNSNGSPASVFGVQIGLNSNSAGISDPGAGYAKGCASVTNAAAISQAYANIIPAPGRTFLAWLESAAASGTMTWYGGASGSNDSGIFGVLQG